jgi:hypothetical protein
MTLICLVETVLNAPIKRPNGLCLIPFVGTFSVDAMPVDVMPVGTFPVGTMPVGAVRVGEACPRRTYRPYHAC